MCNQSGKSIELDTHSMLRLDATGKNYSIVNSSNSKKFSIKSAIELSFILLVISLVTCGQVDLGGGGTMDHGAS